MLALRDAVGRALAVEASAVLPAVSAALRSDLPWRRVFSADSTPGGKQSTDAAEGAGAAAGAAPADAAEAAGVAAAGAAMADAAAEAAGKAAMAGAAAEAAGSATSAEDLSDYHTLLPKLVVFGGNGYVGSRVCQQALAMGCGVVSINRSGRPRNLHGDWLDQVEWVQGDALDPQEAWRGVLKGAAGVVSTLGAFGSHEHMYKICGTANMRLVDAVVAAGVPRFAFISVHDYKFPVGWHAQDFLLRGYFQGKRDAERYMEEKLPAGGVALRPGFIYGTRAVGSTNLHLGWVGAPLKAALGMLPTKTLANVPIIGAGFVPPVSVEAVAKAAVSAVLDPSVPPGVMDVWQIGRYE